MCNILKINSMNYKEIIEKIIENTFDEIKKVYEYQKEFNAVQSPQKIDSRIIFPKNSNGEDRISEQELRFIFVEQLEYYLSKNNISNICYSLETPTKKKYVFPKEGSPRVASADDEKNKKGVSARTDVAIYQKEEDKFKKVALIEFKALNPSKRSYEKDFCKLNNEGESEGILKYFIQIVKNHDGGTIESINDKIKSKKDDVIYKCFCLGTGEEIGEEIINWKPEGE